MSVCRSVPTEDKSFAVGVQYMLFRVLGESSGCLPRHTAQYCPVVYFLFHRSIAVNKIFIMCRTSSCVCVCVCSLHARPGAVRRRHRQYLHPVGQKVRQADLLSLLQPGPLPTQVKMAEIHCFFFLPRSDPGDKTTLSV